MGNNYYPFQQPLDYPLVTGANTLVVSLDEAKEALRIVSDTSQDTLITRLVYTATNYFELVTGRDLISKTYKCYLNNFPTGNIYNSSGYFNYNQNCGIRILRSKLQSITHIKYYVSGVLTTWNSSNYYITDENDYAAIYLTDGSSWPTDADNRMQTIVITFVVGYGAAASDIPFDIKQALLQYIVYLYENRGDCDCSSGGYPASAATFFTTRKIMWLGNIC